MNRFITLDEYRLGIEQNYPHPCRIDELVDTRQMYQDEILNTVNKMSLWTGIPVEPILKDSNIEYMVDKDENIIILGVSYNAF